MLANLKSGSTLRLGWLAVLFRYLSKAARLFSTNSKNNILIFSVSGELFNLIMWLKSKTLYTIRKYYIKKVLQNKMIFIT